MRLKTRTGIYLNGAVWIAFGVYSENGGLAIGAVAFTALLLMLHSIEVKVNKLLDDRGIRVTDRELAD